MINSYTKEEMKRLKEEDYMLWSELTSDPVTGLNNNNEGCISAVIVTILITLIIFGYYTASATYTFCK